MFQQPPKESDNYELVTETEAAAETESTESSSFSESKESESAKTDLVKPMPKLQSMSLLKAKLQTRTSLYRKEKIKYLKQNLR